jgi:AcrR family transcriptional regulator
MQVNSPNMRPPTTNEERSEATRARLLAAARRLFGRRGYSKTSIDELVRRAGVTKGAFYHHFDDKKAIFLAVLEEAQMRLAQRCASAAQGNDAWERAVAGCHGFLEACTDRETQQIILRDGPVVLGWEAWREIDTRYSLGLLEVGLRAAMAEGFVRSRPTKPLVHLLFGSLCEGALLIARAEDPRAALAAVMQEVDEVLSGMLVPAKRPTT